MSTGCISTHPPGDPQSQGWGALIYGTLTQRGNTLELWVSYHTALFHNLTKSNFCLTMFFLNWAIFAFSSCLSPIYLANTATNSSTYSLRIMRWTPRVPPETPWLDSQKWLKSSWELTPTSVMGPLFLRDDELQQCRNECIRRHVQNALHSHHGPAHGSPPPTHTVFDEIRTTVTAPSTRRPNTFDICVFLGIASLNYQLRSLPRRTVYKLWYNPNRE